MDRNPMKLSKQDGFRNKAFLAFVSGKPCVVCGHPGEAHHYGGLKDGRGTGHKGSDLKLVPLCNQVMPATSHHREVERLGREKFEQKYGLDFDSIGSRLFQLFRERNSHD
jgi:hypothetical protein